MFDKICYYFHNQIGFLFCCGFCCWPNKKKILNLIDEAQERLDRELNIVKMVGSLRNMKVLLKSSLMSDPEVQLKIMHCEKNFIDLDVSQESSSGRSSCDASSHSESESDSYG